MTNKDLAYYLKNPGEAHLIPESDLRSWLDRYPYSPGVRWLKARKDLHSSSPSAEESIALAAQYANDLHFLRYQLLRDPNKESRLIKEIQKHPQAQPEFQQVVPPSYTASASKKEEDINPNPTTTEKESTSSSQALDGTAEPNQETQAKNKSSEQLKSTEDKDETEAKPPKQKRASKTTKTKASADTEKRKKTLKTTKKPLQKMDRDRKESQEDESARKKKEQDQKNKADKVTTDKEKAKIVDRVLQVEAESLSEFSQWLLTLDPVQFGSDKKEKEGKKSRKKDKKAKKKRKKSKKKAKAAKKSRLNKLIDQSLAEKEEAVSETYADLLASQGYTDKAVELYEKLKLIYPKKSGYFAAKIENLEKS